MEGLTEGETLGDTEALGDCDGEADGDTEGETDADGLVDGEAEGEALGETEGLTLADGPPPRSVTLKLSILFAVTISSVEVTNSAPPPPPTPAFPAAERSESDALATSTPSS